jgi:hypothetical protein
VISWSEVVGWPDNVKQDNLPVISTDIKVGKYSFSLKVDNDDWIHFLPGSFLIIDEGNKYLKPLNKDFNTVLMDKNDKEPGVMVQNKGIFKI